ncbi:MAG TPA: DUF4912 domain-containing protein [Pyrinomonadaceae bacterium]|nr:DUF4912 domain-containing protein [Pyrinomonadaceae bacterium]
MSTTPPVGSSEHSLREAPPELSPAVKKKLDELAVDEPLPEAYGADRVSLLVQSPYRIYLYWDFAGDPLAPLRKTFGERADQYRVAVRLIDLDWGEESTFEASPFARNYWFNVRPDRAYRAFVGLAAPNRPFVRLLASRLVRTPRTTVANRVDASPEFRVPSIDFARALNYAGFVADAVEVGLEGRDEATGNETSLEIARQLVHADFTGASDAELEELRAVLGALAAGADLTALRAALSPRLAALLDQLLATLDAVRLRELLRGALNFEIKPLDSTIIAVPPLGGASEQHLPLRAFRLTTGQKFAPLPRLPHLPTSQSG